MGLDEVELGSVENRVRYILAHFPEARSNDKYLMLLYWEMVDGIPMSREFRVAFLRRATPPETISRARRKIQQEGAYLPREEVLERRRRLQGSFREWSQQRLL